MRLLNKNIEKKQLSLQKLMLLLDSGHLSPSVLFFKNDK
jgi:hypothetical protein